MCGIAGYHSNLRAEADVVKAMTDKLEHRGPDASGIFCDKQFGIGHRRLSILDLSSDANQPMHSHCNRYCIAYNGEVYNHQEIAQELDVPLSTKSDTEVIIEAFAKWGKKMVNRLNGMFAIAILDKELNKLYFFRDRIGIKPLFIYQHNGVFGFASELKSFNAATIFPLTINRKAIPQFLHLGFIPEPVTIYNEAFKFPSGHYGVFDGNSLETTPYWQLDACIGNQVISDEHEAKETLRDLLHDSVSKRLMSDVPFGTFLSGGIDSSLVTAIAQQSATDRIKSFSIGFAESTHDESKFAREVSTHLGTEHYEYKVTEKDALNLIPVMLEHYDEPYADSSAIPTMLVSKLARQEVTMTLSGDGGDELFHGYGAYNWAERLSRPSLKVSHNVLGNMFELGNNRFKRIGNLLRYNYLTNSHILSQEQYLFSESEIRSLLIDLAASGVIVGNEFDRKHNRKLTPAEAQALFDLKYYLKDDLLTKVDRASMKFSLETRVPILDHRIIEFALNLSPKLKMKQGVQKHLLKQVLYELVPKELFERPKWGFSIPLNQWLLGPLKYLIEENLSKTVVENVGVVKWNEVEVLKTRFFAGHNYLYNRLWLLICLHHWFQTHQSISE